MNINQDDEFAVKIVRVLDQGIERLDARTTAKLLAARKEALAHFQQQPVRAWTPVWATEAIGRIAEPFGNNLRAGLVLLAFLACVAGAIAWQSLSSQASEIAELDQALLTDELPINAYLDKGFDSWLKR